MRILTIFAIVNLKIYFLNAQLSVEVDADVGCDLRTIASLRANVDVGGENEVNGQVNFPSCKCLRRLNLQGSIGAKGSANVVPGGYKKKGDVSQSISVVIPGVNCIETETSEDESGEENSESTTNTIPDADPTEAATVEDEADQGSANTVDITRGNIMYTSNDFILVGAVNTDAATTYYKTMEPGNDLKIFRATLEVDKTSIYDSKSSGKMTGLCDHSYPEGSVEANIWKIINLSVMSGQECPIPKGDNYTVPRDLHSVSLNFDEPMACGDYKLHVDFDTPQNKWAFTTDYKWTMKKDSTDCTDDSEPSEPEPTEPETTEPEPTEPETTEPEPTEPVPPEPEPTEADQGYRYIVNIKRIDILTQENDFIKTEETSSEIDVPLEFYETMDKGNDFKVYYVEMYATNTLVFESRRNSRIKPICDNSYPEGSVEANVWKIFNLAVMGGKECPIEKGDNYTIRWNLADTELTFNEPIPCGEYSLQMYSNSPKGQYAIGITFRWTISKKKHNCTDDVHELK